MGSVGKKVGGALFGEKEKTTISDLTPWISETAEWATKGLKGAQGKLEGGPDYPDGQMTNPYGAFQSLFGGKTGPDYLASFSEAPKQAYNQALTDTKNMFGARGLYGSVGSPLMSGAMASAGQNYAASMADAQQRAQQAQKEDYMTQALGPQWQNELLAQQWQANQNKQQQAIQNYLAAMGVTYPAINQGQVVEKSGGGGGAFGSLAGAAGSLGGLFSDENKKEDIKDITILDKLEKLDIKEYWYKPEWQEASGSENTKHIGPMAQQWAELFGGNGLVIDYQDLMGVMLGAVKELAAKVKKLEDSQNV